MDEYLDYYEQDDDSDDERHFRHLKKVNTGYDNETVKNIRLELSKNQQQKNVFLKTLNNRLNSKNSFESIFDNPDEIGVVLENSYSINNFPLFIEKVMNYYILFKWKDLPLSPMKYDIYNHCITYHELTEWNHHIKIDNFFSPITFEIEEEFNNINQCIESKNTPYLILSNIIEKLSNNKIEQSNNNNIFNIQTLLKYSLFYPLISIKQNDLIKFNKSFSIDKSIEKFESQINKLTIELLIKTIEQEFDAFLGYLVIYNYVTPDITIPLALFLFSCESNDNIIFFVICKIEEKNYNEFLYTYINRNVLHEDDSSDEDEPKNKKKKKVKKNDNLIELTSTIIKENSHIKFSRLHITHIDDQKLIKESPLWKLNLTNSIIRYISYGYIGTEFK